MTDNHRDDVSYTKAEWCARRRVSHTQFYKLLKAGKGPRIHRTGTRLHISSDADRDWVLEREAEAAARSEGA